MAIEGLDGSSGGILGAIATGLASIAGGFLFFKNILRKDTLSAAKNSKEIDILDRLSDELSKANLRADLAEARATESARELHAVLRELGLVQAKVSELTVEVRMLKERLPMATSIDITDYIAASKDKI